MKKIISLLLMITLAISLLACSQKKAEKYTFQANVPNAESTVTLYVKDDNIQRYVKNVTKTYDNKTEEEMEFDKQRLEQYKKLYEDLKGVTCTYEVTDHSATVNHELNIVNKENLKAFLNSVEYKAAYDEKAETYSFEKTKEYLELAGYTLKE